MQIRINKYLASIGVGSRRQIDKLISKGLVEVNGTRLEELGTKIDPEKDKITIEGEEIQYEDPLTYLVLNKPKGVVSTTSDEMGRESVIDLVESSRRLYPVGRLDQDSEGLILLTNDGELTHKLTHPKFHIEKVYLVEVVGDTSEKILDKLRKGVRLKDGVTAPAKVSVEKNSGKRSILRFIITEGKNRQIRRMCGAVDLEVLSLKRISIGPIELGDLKLGKSRKLTEEEIKQLKSTVNL